MQGRVYFYAISAVLMWSTTAALVKSLLTEIPTYEALFVSSLAGALFLIVMQLVRGGGRVFRAYDVRGYAAMAGLGFLGIFLYSGLYYYGLSQLTSQEACILNFLWPMMIVSLRRSSSGSGSPFAPPPPYSSRSRGSWCSRSAVRGTRRGTLSWG